MGTKSSPPQPATTKPRLSPPRLSGESGREAGSSGKGQNAQEGPVHPVIIVSSSQSNFSCQPPPENEPHLRFVRRYKGNRLHVHSSQERVEEIHLHLRSAGPGECATSLLWWFSVLLGRTPILGSQLLGRGLGSLLLSLGWR